MPSRSPTGVIVNAFTVPTMSACWPQAAGAARPTGGAGGGAWANAVVARSAGEALGMISFLISGLLSSCPRFAPGFETAGRSRSAGDPGFSFFVFAAFHGTRLSEAAEVVPDHLALVPDRRGRPRRVDQARHRSPLPPPPCGEGSWY